MKRLMGVLSVVAIVAVTAGSLQAGDRFSPRDRQRPGRGYHVVRVTAVPMLAFRAVAPVTSATEPAGDVIRSFSFEPESQPAVVAPRTAYTPRAMHRGHSRIWRRLHPGSRH